MDLAETKLPRVVGRMGNACPVCFKVARKTYSRTDLNYMPLYYSLLLRCILYQIKISKLHSHKTVRFLWPSVNRHFLYYNDAFEDKLFIDLDLKTLALVNTPCLAIKKAQPYGLLLL